MIGITLFFYKNDTILLFPRLMNVGFMLCLDSVYFTEIIGLAIYKWIKMLEEIGSH